MGFAATSRTKQRACDSARIRLFRLPLRHGAARSSGAVGARGAACCSGITRNGAAVNYGGLVTPGAEIRRLRHLEISAHQCV